MKPGIVSKTQFHGLPGRKSNEGKPFIRNTLKCTHSEKKLTDYPTWASKAQFTPKRTTWSSGQHAVHLHRYTAGWCLASSREDHSFTVVTVSCTFHTNFIDLSLYFYLLSFCFVLFALNVLTTYRTLTIYNCIPLISMVITSLPHKGFFPPTMNVRQEKNF